MSPCISTSERRAPALAVLAAALALATTAPSTASAQPAATCGATDAALPAAYAGWTKATDLASATSATGLTAASVKVGEAARVKLHGTREVTYPLQPEKPGGSVAYGGLVRFSVDAPGAYRVALSSGPWIDVVRDGAAVTSSAHGHGPACSTIRKMVDFPLTPGDYVLQISANAEPEVTVLVVKAP